MTRKSSFARKLPRPNANISEGSQRKSGYGRDVTVEVRESGPKPALSDIRRGKPAKPIVILPGRPNAIGKTTRPLTTKFGSVQSYVDGLDEIPDEIPDLGGSMSPPAGVRSISMAPSDSVSDLALTMEDLCKPVPVPVLSTLSEGSDNTRCAADIPPRIEVDFSSNKEVSFVGPNQLRAAVKLPDEHMEIWDSDEEYVCVVFRPCG
jgi:hypothetical protein